MKQLLITTIAFFFLSIPVFAQTPGRILIIGIDGCRSDALLIADAPNIHGLLDHAVFSYDALTRFPTWSGPCWSSMCTGVWWEKHGVTDNTFTGSNYDQYPHFIHRSELIDPDRLTVSICHWSPINTEINTLCDVELNVNTDLEVKNSAVNYLNVDDPAILFLDFDDVDHAGHTYGFSPTVPEYMASINLTDQYVGEILDALQARPDFIKENWMVILTPDHGGTPSGHGGTSFEERNIFFIAWKPEMDPREIKFDTTQTSLSTGLDFNGINQYLLPDDSSPFSFGTTQDFSVEFRIRYTDLPGDAAFISNKDWANGANPGWVMSTPFSDVSRWKVNIGDGTNRADVIGGSINDGQWHHLTVTFDRDGMMALYEDGNPIGETSMANIGNIDTPFPTVIGQDGTFEYPFFFQGSIAEVRLWKTVLDPQTIAAYACSSIDELHPDLESLISYWKMDEDFGDTIFNSVADAPSATMQGDSAIWIKQPGPLTCYDYSETPKIVDVAVTALTHLCIPIDSAWHLDGRSWVTDCNLVSIDEDRIGNDHLSILPNPANDQLSIEIIHGGNEKNQILSMFDSKGNKVLTTRLYDDTTQLDVSMLPAGLYIISVVSATNVLMTTCIIL